MAICLTCFKPIEEEKLKVLPDARYCIGCARREYGGAPKKRTQEELFQRECQRELSEEQVNASEALRRAQAYLRSEDDGPINGRKKSQPPVLKEEVFDDGRPSQASILLRKKKKQKKSTTTTTTAMTTTTRVDPSGSCWRYQSGEWPLVGDTVFTDNSMCEEFNHMWVVDVVETNMVRCHCESKNTWVHTFYIRSMKLISRLEVVTV
jgi:hypothetical protein